MIQIIGLLLVSWLIIWWHEKGNLSVLGFQPTFKRTGYFFLLLFVSILISASTYLLRMYFAEEQYTVNTSMNAQLFFQESWFQIRSVLTEELLCRGVLLYIMIRQLGTRKAIVLSSLIFALLHWFNSGVWGNLPQMAMVFVFTFAMGLLLAYAFTQSKSILLPFAIHLGWNWVQNFVFPDNAAAHSVFVLVTPPPTVTISYLAFFTMLLFPKIAVLAINYGIVRSYKSADS